MLNIPPPELTLSLLVGITFVAMLAEYVDATLGMGYGTTLTPALLLLGFEPLDVVPAILLCELCAGLMAGVGHQLAGNARFFPERDTSGAKKTWRERSMSLPQDLRIGLVIGGAGLLGAAVAPLVAINLPTIVLKLYIGVLVSVIGLVLVLARGRKLPFSWRRIWILGLIASVNKGMSGGGYGPVVAGGQLLSGVNGRSAIAVTALTEGFVCLVAVTTYKLAGLSFNWGLTLALMAGAAIAVPLSVITVKILDPSKLRSMVGGMTLTVGAVTLIKLAL